MPSGRTNNFPETGRGLGYVTPTIFGIRSNISLKLLELETSNLIHGFALGMPSRRTNNFHESRCGLGHVTATIFGSTVGYPSDSLASCCYWTTLYRDCNCQAKVQRIYVDGVDRTKNDIITQHVKDVFSASNFDEVCVIDNDSIRWQLQRQILNWTFKLFKLFRFDIVK